MQGKYTIQQSYPKCYYTATHNTQLLRYTAVQYTTTSINTHQLMHYHSTVVMNCSHLVVLYMSAIDCDYIEIF